MAKGTDPRSFVFGLHSRSHKIIHFSPCPASWVSRLLASCSTRYLLFDLVALDEASRTLRSATAHINRSLGGFIISDRLGAGVSKSVEIEIQERREDGCLVYNIKPSGSLSRYFHSNSLRIMYDFDVSELPRSIQLVPAVCEVCAVAWATNSTISIPEADETFLASLEDVHQRLSKEYPRVFRDSPKLDAESITDVTHDTSESLLNFTGGIDSTASFFRHRDNSPILVTVRNAYHTASEWEKIESYTKRFADGAGVTTRFVVTNRRQVRNRDALNAKCKPNMGRNWGGAVQYGLSYFGHCAPISYWHGAGTVYQGASYTPKSTYPDAHKVADELEWADAVCEVDGIRLSRQEKIDLIADHVDDIEYLQLIVCENRQPANCSACKKCYRTILGLLTAGLDPTQHGFDTNQQTLDQIRREFESEEIELTEYELVFFNNIQDHISVEQFGIEGKDAFVHWFKHYSFEQNLRIPGSKMRVYNAIPHPINDIIKNIYNWYRFRSE